MLMFEVRQTDDFRKWLKKLRQEKMRSILLERIRRVRLGNLGDAKSVGDGVKELRVHIGPGYRVYFTQEGKTIIVLLCGGDKSSQERDIQKAKKLAKALKD